MTIYSSMIPDSNILTSLKGMKSTLIVGCASCANTSIAYDKNLPVYKIQADEKTGNKTMMPHAVLTEAERIKLLLETNKIYADIDCNDAWCMTTNDDELRALMGNPGWTDPGFRDRATHYDSILVLGCHDAVRGIKERVEGRVNVIPGMSTVGTQFVSLHLDEGKEFVLLDKGKSTPIRNIRKP